MLKNNNQHHPLVSVIGTSLLTSLGRSPDLVLKSAVAQAQAQSNQSYIYRLTPVQSNLFPTQGSDDFGPIKPTYAV